MDMSRVVVRRASRADVDLVLSATELFACAPTREWTQDFLDRGTNHLLVALVDDRPVGMLSAVETSHLGTSPDLFVYDMRVVPAARGQGLGRRLVDKAVSVAEESGFRQVWGSVNAAELIPARSPFSPPDALTREATTFVIPVS